MDEEQRGQEENRRNELFVSLAKLVLADQQSKLVERVLATMREEDMRAVAEKVLERTSEDWHLQQAMIGAVQKWIEEIDLSSFREKVDQMARERIENQFPNIIEKAVQAKIEEVKRKVSW